MLPISTCWPDARKERGKQQPADDDAVYGGRR